MLHLLEVQHRARDLEDGLAVDHDGIGACVEGSLLGKVESLLSTA